MHHNLDSTLGLALINTTNGISGIKCGRFIAGLHTRQGWSFFFCMTFQYQGSQMGLLSLFTILLDDLAHSHEFHYYLGQSALRNISLAPIYPFKPQDHLSVCWVFLSGCPPGISELYMSKTKFIITSIF